MGNTYNVKREQNKPADKRNLEEEETVKGTEEILKSIDITLRVK